MFRRIITRHLIALLLVPGYCATHSHAEVSAHDPSGLFRRPHFHVRVFSGWLNLVNPRTNSDKGDSLPVDHDSDAVYVPDSILSGWLSDPAVVPVDSIAVMAVPAATPHASPVLFTIEADERPIVVPPCPLYLLSVSLLI